MAPVRIQLPETVMRGRFPNLPVQAIEDTALLRHGKHGVTRTNAQTYSVCRRCIISRGIVRASQWGNRLIGDENWPEDSDCNPNGTLKSWPEWVQQEKPSPTGRFSFTSWRLWTKGDPLQISGLLGPVSVLPVAQVPVP